MDPALMKYKLFCPSTSRSNGPVIPAEMAGPPFGMFWIGDPLPATVVIVAVWLVAICDSRRKNNPIRTTDVIPRLVKTISYPFEPNFPIQESCPIQQVECTTFSRVAQG